MYSQPAPEISKSKRGLVLGIAGTGLAVVAVALAVVIITLKPDILNNGGSSTPTDQPAVNDETTLDLSRLNDVEEAANDFAAALDAQDLSSLDFAEVRTEGVVSSYNELTGGLGNYSSSTTVTNLTLIDSNTATADFETTWEFPGGVDWSSTGSATLLFGTGPAPEPVEEQITADGATPSSAAADNATAATTAIPATTLAPLPEAWRVQWTPKVLEASLAAGDRLRFERVAPKRAPILDRDGNTLVANVELVTIGVRPSRVKDLPTLITDLANYVDIDQAALTADIQNAAPDDFVEVAQLPKAEYDQIRDFVFPLPGTVFRSRIEPVVTDPNLAPLLIGSSGEVTAEIMEANPDLFEPGDIVGRSGLQAALNAELTGTPGAVLGVLRAGGVGSGATEGTDSNGLTTTSAVRRQNELETFIDVPAIDGEPAILTIDSDYQRLAQAAVSTWQGETAASLVIIEVSSGEVLAIANGQGSNGLNFAMTGQYPPGSIFKIVSGYAILRDRIPAEGRVDCPSSVTIKGREFSNAGGEVLGNVDFRTAFAHSCNTAFINATLGFGNETLTRTAAEFGIGADYDLAGLSVFRGNVPIAEDEVEVAATSFGQGRTLLSPFAAAVMAATAADRTYRSPVLVTSGNPEPQTVIQLEPGPAESLRELMRAVITEGTAQRMQNVPGAPVAGKTGTAEFGNDVPPKSHAWFAGFQGNLAFAAFVEAGEFGSSAAAPIAGNFLASVNALEAANAQSAQSAQPAPSDEPDEQIDNDTSTTEPVDG